MGAGQGGAGRPDDPRYGDQFAGGSTAISDNWDGPAPGGGHRAASADRGRGRALGGRSVVLPTEPGAVLHPSSGRRLDYGDVAADAAKRPVPEEVPLKDPRTLSGWSAPGSRGSRTRSSSPGGRSTASTRGCPGMLFACVLHPPFGTGWPRSTPRGPSGCPACAGSCGSSRSRARCTSGRGWRWWPTRPGRRCRGSARSRRRWEAVPATPVSTPRACGARCSTPSIARARRSGATATSTPPSAGAARAVEATYEVPLLAHAPMEPMNCLADVRADRARGLGPDAEPRTACRDWWPRVTGLEPLGGHGSTSPARAAASAGDCSRTTARRRRRSRRRSAAGAARLDPRGRPAPRLLPSRGVHRLRAALERPAG